MKPAFYRTTLAAAFTMVALSAHASSQNVCMDTVEMESALKDWYGEAPIEDYSGQKRQVWASKATGTWTVLQYLSDGNSCVLQQGENWPNVAEDNPLLAALSD